MEQTSSPPHALAEPEATGGGPDAGAAPPMMEDRQLRRLVEATKAVPWEANAETWQFTYVGPQAVQLLGYPVEQWYTKDFWVSALHPDDRETAIATCLQSAARTRDYEFEYRMVAADGGAVWIHDIVNVVAEHGRPKILRGYMLDVTGRRDAEAAARRVEQEHLAFERLVAEVSATFVRVPAEETDARIEDALALLGNHLRLDRAALQQYSDERSSFCVTHVWMGDEVGPAWMAAEAPGDPLTGQTYPTGRFPWLTGEVLAGRTVVVPRVEELPPEAAAERRFCQAKGIRSFLMVPLVGGGTVLGHLALSTLAAERPWAHELVQRLRLLGEIFVNALERQRAEEQLGDLLRFERLLSHLSAECANLPAAELDQEIRHGLQRIGEFLGVDRASLSEFSADDGTFRIIHWWGRQGIQPPDPVLLREHFPWVSERLLRGEIVCFARPEDLPDEARLDREAYRRRGVTSHILVPLAAGGSPVGAVSFTMVRAGRSWAAALVQRLRLVGEILANALERQRAEAALRESEARFRQVADASPVMIWMSGLDKGCTYFNKGWLEFTGRPTEQELGQGWAEGVHPDDLQRCLDTYVHAFDARERFSMEYRLRRHDGEYRWIWDIGVPRFVTGGRFEGYIGSCTDVTERKRMEEESQARLREIEDLTQRLEAENISLREEVKVQRAHEDIVGQSAVMKRVLAQAAQVARTNSTVLILGETGTGKELLAKAIHNLSARRDRVLVTANGASLPPSLIESELFGREKGAYTGALTRMGGRFEVADGSTLFLDEIGELPLEVQAKLLRVLQEGHLERLGSTKTLRVDVRVIAATNRDLDREVSEGRFRRDLYYRLNVFPIVIPPLRERPEDIPLLVWTYVEEFGKKMGKRIESIPRRAMDALQRHPWPGNARELRNVIERAMIVSSGKILEVRIPTSTAGGPVAPQNLEDLDRGHILKILGKTGWRVAGRGGAAEILGLNRTTLHSRMKRLGIKRPSP